MVRAAGIADLSGAGALILALPAAVGILLSASGEHPLASMMMRGARALIVASALLAFAAAAGLALEPSVGTLRIVLGVAAGLSVLPLAGLVTIYLLAPRPYRRGPPG